MARKAASSKKDRNGKDARATEAKITHATNHPIRLDALSILFEREASPNEIANLLRKPLSTVSFHITQLHEVGAIELVHVEPRRGAVEHFYRAIIEPEVDMEEWREMPKAARRTVVSVALQAIVAEGLASLRHGLMEDNDDTYVAWMPMKLDAEGQAELTELQAEWLARLKAVQDRSNDRLGEGGTAGPVRIAAILSFERANPTVG